MESLLTNVRNCQICKDHFVHDPNPVLTAHPESKIVIIGQAPGAIVHQTSIPWNDKSGDNLRRWLGINRSIFYDQSKIALIPMGFCYPGKGKSGDLPPRSECAPLWHDVILHKINNVKLTLLIGQYAQNYYLVEQTEKTLTATVHNYQKYLPQYFVLPHPSPRNNIWRAKNPWFDQKIIPELQKEVARALE